MVVKEVLQTEEDYTKDLKLLRELYLVPIKNICKADPTFFPSDIMEIFNQFWPSFISLHEELAKEFKERIDNWHPNQIVGDIFTKKAEYLKIYSTYCHKYGDIASTILPELRKNEAYKEFEDRTNEALKMQVEYFLIKPVQRITKYGILVTRILSETWEENPDYPLLVEAAEVVRTKLDFINSSVLNRQEIIKISKELKIDNLISPAREYLKQEEFMNGKEKIRVYLLNDHVIVATIKPTKLKFAALIPLHHLWSVPGAIKSKNNADASRLFFLGDETHQFACMHTVPSTVQQWVSDIRNAQQEHEKTIIFRKRENWVTDEKKRVNNVLSEYPKDIGVIQNCFFFAARRGFNDVLRVILQDHPELANSPSSNYYNRLATFEALAHSRFDTVAFLLGWGADINHQDSNNQTLLILATKFRDIPMIRWLISRGASACLTDFLRRTPLHIACHIENDEISIEITRLLMNYIRRDSHSVLSLKNILEKDLATNCTCDQLVTKAGRDGLAAELEIFLKEVSRSTLRRSPAQGKIIQLDFLIPNFNDDYSIWETIKQNLKQIPNRHSLVFRYDLARVSSLHNWAEELLKEIQSVVDEYETNGREVSVNIIAFSAGTIIVRLALQKYMETKQSDTWKCSKVIFLAPAIFGSSLASYNKRNTLQFPYITMFDTVESIVTRMKPTSPFIHHLAEKDIFLPKEQQFYNSNGIHLFILQGTKQYNHHTMKKPPSGSAFRGSDGIVPYSASGMNAVKWFLDLDNNVDDGESDAKPKQQLSTVQCIRRYFPHHTHDSLLNSVANKGDIFAQILSALIKTEEEFQNLEVTEADNGDWRLVRTILHKPASLVVFRYNGTLFPSLEPSIIEHEADYQVYFDQAVSNGDANFTPVTDPRIAGQIKNTFGSTSFQLKGKAWHNVADLSSVSSGLEQLSKITKKSYSFVLKFKDRPCGKLVGSTQWKGFFPNVDSSSVLIIEVSPMVREASGDLTSSISITDSLEEIMRKIEVAADTDINETISSLGATAFAEIFSRFVETSAQEFERFIDKFVGLYQNMFTVYSRVVIIKALSTLFPNSYALEASHSLIVTTELSEVSNLKRELDGGRCFGYFDLYSLVYELFNVRFEPVFLKKFVPTKHSGRTLANTISSKITLTEETLSFFKAAIDVDAPKKETRLIAFVNDVVITQTDSRFRVGHFYPGSLSFLKKFSKTNQSDIAFVDYSFSSKFMKSAKKRLSCVFLSPKEKEETLPVVVNKAMDLYEEANFVVLTCDTASVTKVNSVLKKNKRIKSVFCHALLGISSVEPQTPRSKSKMKRAKSKLSGSTSIQNQMFGTYVSLTRLMISAELLDEAAFLQVAGDIVVELRETTFNSFSVTLMKRWKEVERDLEGSREQCKNARGLDKLLRAVQRVYPALLLSDYGIDVIMKLYESPGDISVENIIKQTDAKVGNKSLVRRHSTVFE